ncbi:hypothetical protein TF3313_2310 [Tannerella forsythia 3313]|jgi:hypothetical protein
MIKS